MSTNTRSLNAIALVFKHLSKEKRYVQPKSQNNLRGNIQSGRPFTNRYTNLSLARALHALRYNRGKPTVNKNGYLYNSQTGRTIKTRRQLEAAVRNEIDALNRNAITLNAFVLRNKNNNKNVRVFTLRPR
jgi:hypothetical protein